MAYLITGLILVYKRTFSGLLGRLFGSGCRYYPTCSDYAIEAIKKHGVAKGGLTATKRLLRCHPFSNGGYYDPLSIEKS